MKSVVAERVHNLNFCGADICKSLFCSLFCWSILFDCNKKWNTENEQEKPTNVAF